MNRTAYFDAEAPCLCVDWHEDAARIFAGCTSRAVKGFDLIKYKGFEIGSHEGIVKDVFWLAETNTLCSVSTDKTVRFWDLRQSGHMGEIRLEYKPFCSDLCENQLAVGLSESKFTLIDLVEAQKAQGAQLGLYYGDCPLGKEDALRSIKFLADGSGLAFGSVGGRCNISKLDRTVLPKISLGNVTQFKAHKVDGRFCSKKLAMAYPLDSILTNSRKANGFLGSCGGEGRIVFWDFAAKNKICEFDKKAPVTCGKMSWDGRLLAYAVGEDWSRGIEGYMTKSSEVYVRFVQENQLFDQR